MKKPLNQFKNRIGLIVCSILATALGTTFIITLSNVYSYVQEDVISNTENKLGYVSENTSAFLQTAKTTVETYSRNVEYLLRGGITHEGLYNYLVNETDNSLRQIRPEGDFTGLYGYFKIDNVGKYLDGNKWIPDDSYDPKTRPWYEAAKEEANRDVAMASPYVDLSFDDNRIVLSVTKMLSDGESVFGMDIKLDYIQDNLFNLVNPNEFNYTYILDNRGTIVASQVKVNEDQEAIDERARNYLDPSLSEYPDAEDIYGMKEIFETAFKNDEYFKRNINGVSQYVFSKTIVNNWQVIISTQESTIATSVDSAFVFSLVITILFLLLSIYFLVSSFVERHKREIIEKQEANNLERLENYKKAILNDALIYLETNLTTDELTFGSWKDDQGNEIGLHEILGIEFPCSYDKYIDLWKQKFVSMSSVISFHTNSDREQLLKKFNAGISEITFDYEALTISGKKTWLRRSICMIKNRNGDIVAYTSVKNINELIEANRRNETYIEALATEYDSIAVVDFNEDKTMDSIKFHSRINEQLLKYIPKQTLEESCFSKRLQLLSEIVYQTDRVNFVESTRRESIFKAFEKGENHNVTFRIAAEDGECIYYQDCFIPLKDLNGDIVGMVSCLRNITTEITTEIGIRNELESAKEKAEAASQTKTRFLFNMSHDIRTPMNAILGFTQIAQKNLLKTEYVEDCLKKIELSGQQLLLLINEVLEMSRIESGNFQIEYEPAKIKDIFVQIAPLFDSQAAAKNINFSIEYKNIDNEYVYIDSLHTNRLLTNLISNAIKYTPSGGKVVALMEQITKETDGYVTYKFTVRDNGIGMSEDFIEHMFEEFAREKSTTLSKETGTGLGLSIVKRLSELLGGTINVKSKINEGSTFEFILPLKIETPEEIAINHQQKESHNNQNIDINSLKHKRVLLVEDNELNREIAAAILEEKELDVEYAENGEIAVAMYKDKNPGYYDFILMDIQMPVMDGFEATTTIRQYEGGKHHVPIIAVSANAFEEDKIRSLESGMDDHIAKPINIDELINSLENLLTK